MARSQSQPYRAGCADRPPRLALNTTAATTATTAATEPSSAERTGTARTPDPGSNALRVPTTAAAGSPAAAAARGTADDAHPRPAAARPDRPDRQHGQQPEQGQAEHGRTPAEDEPVGTDPVVRV